MQEPSKLKSASPHVLVVDDDERIRQLLCRYLSEQGFTVSEAKDAAEARQILSYLRYDMIVLDVMMPGEDGMSLTAHLKQEGLKTPVLLLTALGETSSRIDGLTSGADDYLSKPFEPKELLLRINAILRRTMTPVKAAVTSADSTGILNIGDWAFNAEKGELKNGEESIFLTQAELSLFKALAAKAGQVISREDLAESCGLAGNERTIDVQITRLRKKLGDDPRQPRYVQTIRGKGYVLWTQ